MYERIRLMQKLDFGVCAASVIGICGTLGGFGAGKMEAGCMALLLILFTALLASNIFILLDCVERLARQNRYYRRFL